MNGVCLQHLTEYIFLSGANMHDPTEHVALSGAGIPGPAESVDMDANNVTADFYAKIAPRANGITSASKHPKGGSSSNAATEATEAASGAAHTSPAATATPVPAGPAAPHDRSTDRATPHHTHLANKQTPPHRAPEKIDQWTAPRRTQITSR